VEKKGERSRSQKRERFKIFWCWIGDQSDGEWITKKGGFYYSIYTHN